MRSLLLTMGAAALLFTAGQTAQAQEPADDTAKIEAVKALHDATEALTKDLSEADKLHFYAIYNNYNLIKTVETVRGDVEMAVQSCGKENPDLKEKIATRFETWKAAVNPVLAEAQGHTENMVSVQEYAAAESIENIFTKIDAARTTAESQITKVPVTSPEACNFLHDKMDETQSHMVDLLRATLMSYPQTQGLEKAPETEEAKPAPETEEAPEAEPTPAPSETSPAEETEKPAEDL